MIETDKQKIDENMDGKTQQVIEKQNKQHNSMHIAVHLMEQTQQQVREAIQATKLLQEPATLDGAMK